MIVPMAGIGASAGGLEACKLLLAHLPGNPGMAFVLVQHLDPTHDSNPTEILARTGAIPVRQATDGMPIEPDYLYIPPPGAELEIANQALRLTPRDPAPSGPHMPIDRFLLSLAQECGSRAIGVILSGTGADGVSGLEAVKASGGVTLAQDPATAKFGSMPQAAIGGGASIWYCHPRPLPPSWSNSAVTPTSRKTRAKRRWGMRRKVNLKPSWPLCRDATGIDFALYRERPVKHRILRRLALRNIDSLAEYRTRLEHDALRAERPASGPAHGHHQFFPRPGIV